MRADSKKTLLALGDKQGGSSALNTFFYFFAYFTHSVQIPFSGGNMCVILHFFLSLKFYVAVLLTTTVSYFNFL